MSPPSSSLPLLLLRRYCSRSVVHFLHPKKQVVLVAASSFSTRPSFSLSASESRPFRGEDDTVAQVDADVGGTTESRHRSSPLRSPPPPPPRTSFQPPPSPSAVADAATVSPDALRDMSTPTDIEDLHTSALLSGSKTYVDPSTGFTVFTELAHLRRGRCCGSMCRHCPYGWENVEGEYSKEAKVQSGDAEGVRRLLERLEFLAEGTTTHCDGDGGDEKKDDGSLSSTSQSSSGSDSSEATEYLTPSGGETEVEDRGGPKRTMTTTPPKPSKTGVAAAPHLASATAKSESKSKSVAATGGRRGGALTSKNVPYTRTGDSGTSQLFTGERRSKSDDAFEAMGAVDELCSVVGVAHAMMTTNAATVVGENRGENDGAAMDYGELPEWLLDVMSRLFDAGSHIAKPPPRRRQGRQRQRSDSDSDSDSDFKSGDDDDSDGARKPPAFPPVHSTALESRIDLLTDPLPELTSFILPTGSPLSAQFHVARTVCRRAERRTVPLVTEGEVCPEVGRYLNRLSDFFFAAARYVNWCEGREEVLYRRAKQLTEEDGITTTRGIRRRERVTVRLRAEEEEEEEVDGENEAKR